MNPGLFITFEGGEGAGKTTQIKKLADSLGSGCIVTREPGGTPEAEAIRDTFIEQKGQNWPPEALVMLMFSARILHTENLIRPSVMAGKTVLSDRYTDSTRVYQGYAGGLSLEKIELIKEIAIGGFEPDITFVLDIDPKEGLKRTASGRDQSGDTFETKDISFHQKLREGFLDIAKKNPARCVMIDATLDKEIIAAQILQRVKNVR
jgi:dTMP kinase